MDPHPYFVEERYSSVLDAKDDNRSYQYVLDNTDQRWLAEKRFRNILGNKATGDEHLAAITGSFYASEPFLLEALNHPASGTTTLRRAAFNEQSTEPVLEIVAQKYTPLIKYPYPMNNRSGLFQIHASRPEDIDLFSAIASHKNTSGKIHKCILARDFDYNPECLENVFDAITEHTNDLEILNAVQRHQHVDSDSAKKAWLKAGWIKAQAGPSRTMLDRPRWKEVNTPSSRLGDDTQMTKPLKSQGPKSSGLHY